MAIDGRRGLIVGTKAPDYWSIGDRVTRLRDLWENHPELSTAKIARLIGDDCSKNAVISKARRLDLAPRREAVAKPERTSAIGDLVAGQCRFPIGHPNSADFHFCQERAGEGRSYCDHHHKVTHWRTGTGPGAIDEAAD